jgi:multiple sugar transport system ATP-binding protein
MPTLKQILVPVDYSPSADVALRLGRHPLMAAFRQRVGARSGERLALRPLAHKAHLFDATGNERLN